MYVTGCAHNIYCVTDARKLSNHLSGVDKLSIGRPVKPARTDFCFGQTLCFRRVIVDYDPFALLPVYSVARLVEDGSLPLHFELLRRDGAPSRTYVAG